MYASFDAGAAPDYALGSPGLRRAPNPPDQAPGRVGEALRLPDDQAATALSFAGPGNLNRACGTIAFWVRPTWEGRAGEGREPALQFLFSMSGLRIYA
ncbi:MAG TPA: hypothetical protein VM283_02915, partial [Armatimonadota bacterium]|nr:hypothetical protein [Armatimonadota bacterium]